MRLAHGEGRYLVGDRPCTGFGLKWTSEELNNALSTTVAAMLFDDEGNHNINTILSEIVDSQFQEDRLKEILAPPDNIESWKVGESIARAWLTNHRCCCFPWPAERDQRKHGSSLPGADLVGLYGDSDSDCFAFGEVKTSSDTNCPPRIVCGSKGLKQQLKDLRDCVSIRNHLVKYLYHRAKDSTWIERLQRAMKRYMENPSDVRLFGFLVRDVPPNKNDLRACTESLSQHCPDEMTIEVIALYLPIDRLRRIGKFVIAARLGD